MTASLPRTRRLGRVVMLYLLTMLVLAGVLWSLSDRWWPATLVMYAPRWVWLLPWPVLVLWAWRRERRQLWWLALAALVWLWGVMGWRWQGLATVLAEPPAADLRVASYNLGGGAVDPSALPALLGRLAADVVVMQECAATVQAAQPLLEREGWQVNVRHSACLASRHPITRVEDRPPQDVWQLGGSGVIVRYTIQTPQRVVQVLNLHLETVRDGLVALRNLGLAGVDALQDNLAQRDLESNLALAWARQASAPMFVAGDFNMPVESAIYRRYWGEFTNGFSRAGWGLGHTKFTRWHGIRIDHVLGGPGWQCVQATVVEGLGNDHRPVVTAWRWVP